MSPKADALRLGRDYRLRLSAALRKPVRVVLFGSQARGDSVPGSDVDLFVVLPDLKKTTLDKALEIAWEVGFDAGVVLSVMPATKSEIPRLKSSPFYQNVQREGVVV